MIHTTFYIRRLHSLCGIVPVGLFLLEHIFTNSMVLGGPAPFNAAVEHLASIPHEIMLPLEICFILVPFLFHGLYGLYILMQAKKLWLCSQLEFLFPKNNCCYYLPFLNLACCLSPHYGKRWRYSYFLRIITSLFPKSACMGCLYNRYDCIYFPLL